jgi:hypothetical protein
MRNEIIIGIFAASSFLTGCRRTPTAQSAPTPQSATAQSGTPESDTAQSDINKVRNGYLKYNQTTTIGQALEHTFSSSTWKSFTTAKGTTIVEFDGSAPHGELSNGLRDCNSNLICAALDKKIEADCNSNSDALSYKTTYDNLNLQISEVNQKLDALNKQLSNNWSDQARDNLYRKGGEYDELLKNRPVLQNQLRDLTDPKPACFDNAYKQNAGDPIPVVVQFSINHDGTFQYLASDTFTPEELFSKMYN